MVFLSLRTSQTGWGVPVGNQTLFSWWLYENVEKKATGLLTLGDFATHGESKVGWRGGGDRLLKGKKLMSSRTLRCRWTPYRQFKHPACHTTWALYRPSREKRMENIRKEHVHLARASRSLSKAPCTTPDFLVWMLAPPRVSCTHVHLENWGGHRTQPSQ